MNNEKNIRKFFERYPKATLQDIFKMEYQSILGTGHLIKNEESVLKFLKEECDNLIYRDELLNEPLTEEIGNGMIRVNLRPYVHKKYSLEELAKMFYKTKDYSKHQKTDLLFELEENKENIKCQCKTYKEEVYQELVQRLIDTDFSSFSHSLIYRSHYLPSYRIVAKELFTNYLDSMQKE